MGYMEWKRSIVYIIAQYIGALVGYGALWVILFLNIKYVITVNKISIKRFLTVAIR